jgi:ubiquinone/menaquinone biosynthesis C-methylase UbiE
VAGAQPADAARKGRRGGGIGRSGLSSLWSTGQYERIAERFAPIHDELVAALEPRPGDRWLDLGTGTGQVALRAARAGASVTGVDISPTMLDRARANADAEGLELVLEEGDVQALSHGTASFDVVSSCFGLVFAPDRPAVASELARVCAPGGRFGMTAWRPRPAQQRIYDRFAVGPGPEVDHSDWARDGFAEELLGPGFELERTSGTWFLEAESPESLYEFWIESAPPTKRFVEELPEERREPFRAAMVEHWRRFADTDGRVSEPREYVLITGRRR